MHIQNPITVQSGLIAEGAIAGRSLVTKGTASTQAKAVAAANAAVIGYVPDAYATGDTNVQVEGDGALVELVAEGTLENGDFVVAKSETEVQSIATLNPADKDLLNIVGRVESNGQITDGNRVHVRLKLFAYNHAE